MSDFISNRDDTSSLPIQQQKVNQSRYLYYTYIREVLPREPLASRNNYLISVKSDSRENRNLGRGVSVVARYPIGSITTAR